MRNSPGSWRPGRTRSDDIGCGGAWLGLGLGFGLGLGLGFGFGFGFRFGLALGIGIRLGLGFGFGLADHLRAQSAEGVRSRSAAGRRWADADPDGDQPRDICAARCSCSLCMATRWAGLLPSKRC